MWSLCFILVVYFGFSGHYRSNMAEKRPRRQRKVRSSTEFFGAGLLHKEEVELRRALYASLKEVRNAHQKKEERPVEPVVTTRSISTTARASQPVQDKPDKPVTTRTVCTGTNTRFRIKKKSGNTKKQSGDSLGKEGERRENGSSHERNHLLTKALKRKDVGEEISSFKKIKKETEKDAEETIDREKGVRKTKKSLKKETGKSIARKELKSPPKINNDMQHSWKKELKILPKSKASLHKSLDNKKVKGSQKSKVVQSLTLKFSATVKDEKQPVTKGKKGSKGQGAVESCSDQVKKKKSALQRNELEKTKQYSSLSEGASNPDNICELRRQVSNSLQGKVRRRLNHKFKNRRLVSPLGEIYIPANIAKTEDFLTFLCLRGNSSLPRSFEVFNDPDPFLTQPAHQFPNNAAVSCPVLPMQSSVIYSPPSSSAPSESSVASPMSSVDGWAINDDLSV